MADHIDTEYYARRAEAAKRAAEKAGDPIAKRIHDTMATRYEQLAQQPASMQPQSA